MHYPYSCSMLQFYGWKLLSELISIFFYVVLQVVAIIKSFLSYPSTQQFNLHLIRPIFSDIKLFPLSWCTSSIQDMRLASGKPFRGAGLTRILYHSPDMVTAFFRWRDEYSLTYFPRRQCFRRLWLYFSV